MYGYRAIRCYVTKNNSENIGKLILLPQYVITLTWNYDHSVYTYHTIHACILMFFFNMDQETVNEKTNRYYVTRCTDIINSGKSKRL